MVSILDLSGFSRGFALALGFALSAPIPEAHARSAVVITSPAPAFATNASELQVTVRFEGAHPSEGHQTTQIRLLLDERLVGSYDVPAKVKQGSRSFSVDVSGSADAIVQLRALVVRTKSSKGKDKKSDERIEAASANVPVLLDKTPPVVRVASPLQYQIVADPVVSIEGSATDNLSGIDAMSVNGISSLVSGGVFSVPVPLPAGSNALLVSARDRAGNASSFEITVLKSEAAVQRPIALTLPPVAAVVGRQLSYQSVAAALDPAALRFSLQEGSAGMQIDAVSGLLTWTPSAEQVGDHRVTVAAATDLERQTKQSFTISVFGTRQLAAQAISATNGGVITVDDPASAVHRLAISIPPNALLADTTIVVSELIRPPTLGGVPRLMLKGVLVEPAGTELSALATISIPYHPSQFATNAGVAEEGFLGAYYLDSATGELESLASFSVESVNKVVTGSVAHFSVYLVTNMARLCPPPTTQSDCPTAVPPVPSRIPVMTLHGLQLAGATASGISNAISAGMGDESTWGQLRYLLGKVDHPSGDGRIDAWRFDWDSRSTPFEMSAEKLAHAITRVKQATGHSKVNMVAHSFGGLLARTYLQGRADFGRLAYRGDVDRLMTIGTPHQGIGGDLSTLADLCAVAPSLPQPLTCFQTNIGAPRRPGEGLFIKQLNLAALPPALQHVVQGQALEASGPLGARVQLDDGLITTKGSTLDGVPGLDVIAEGIFDGVGLCHTGDLIGITCEASLPAGFRNVAMAEVNDKGHPLWQRICTFLAAPAEKCLPQLVVQGSTGGRITAANKDTGEQGIDCGNDCSEGYAASTTVRLTAHPQGNFKFSGWSGDCISPTRECIVHIGNADKFVTAAFSEETQPTGPQYIVAPAGIPGDLSYVSFNSKRQFVWNVRGTVDNILQIDGKMFHFSVAGANQHGWQVQALAINDRGDIAGTFCDPTLWTFVSNEIGFVGGCRIFVTSISAVFDTDPVSGIRYAPRSEFNPTSMHYWFDARLINEHGDIAGFYEPPPDASDIGFVMPGTGGFAPFQASDLTYPEGMNDRGDIVGMACAFGASCRPFHRRPDGSYAPVPAEAPENGSYLGIDNAGRALAWAPVGHPLYPGFLVQETEQGPKVIPLPSFGDGVSLSRMNAAGQILFWTQAGGYFLATPVQ